MNSKSSYTLPDNQVYLNFVAIAWNLYYHCPDCSACLGYNIQLSNHIIRKAKEYEQERIASERVRRISRNLRIRGFYRDDSWDEFGGTW